MKTTYKVTRRQLAMFISSLHTFNTSDEVECAADEIVLDMRSINVTTCGGIVLEVEDLKER